MCQVECWPGDHWALHVDELDPRHAAILLAMPVHDVVAPEVSVRHREEPPLPWRPRLRHQREEAIGQELGQSRTPLLVQQVSDLIHGRFEEADVEGAERDNKIDPGLKNESRLRWLHSLVIAKKYGAGGRGGKKC